MAVRLVTWNCCGSFAQKYAHLLDLDFDLTVVSECAPLPADTDTSSRGLTQLTQQPFPGTSKHLGVFARSPWRIEPVHGLSARPWLLPVRVTGPRSFVLLAFWAAEPRRFGSYTDQMARVIDDVLPAVEGEVVIAGDWNAPIPSSAAAHARNTAALAEHDLVDAFTTSRTAPDRLAEPTYFHWRKENQPFHIDHVFVPRAWAQGISLDIGTYDEWVASARSDHVPLVLDSLD